MTVGPHSTKLPQSWDTRSDQPGVPACTDSEANFFRKHSHEEPVRYSSGVKTCMYIA